jgi:hypothetical protein
MSKVKDADLSMSISSKLGPSRKLIVVDNQLLALLNQLVAMGLATTWEVRVNEPIEYEYTATKLMLKLAKKMHGPTKP